MRFRAQEEGSASVELAILFPLALLMLLLAVQTGLWWHTRTLCQHAATQAVQAARTTGGTPADAQAAAWGFLGRSGTIGGAPAVAVDASATEVSVTVSATAPRVIPVPGLDFRVTSTAHAAKERFTTPTGGSGSADVGTGTSLGGGSR